MLCFMSCKSAPGSESVKVQEEKTKDTPLAVVTGAEQTEEYLSFLRGKRVAFVVNQTSVIGHTHLVDTMQKLGINISKVFAPEHGFRGDHSDGAVIQSGIDEKTGLKVVSLYGSNKKPTREMLSDVDVVVFDIQDVGVRFYTFISTMHYVMEACAEQNKQCIVLDRPNPNGFYIDGPVLKEEFSSFIGMHPIPIVHGLTVAELAAMINGEGWLKGKIKCNLHLVKCLNYTHASLYQLPIAPSPNLPNMNSVYLYPYLGLFEGTNVSVGRGTDLPFQQIGRPGFKGPIAFTPRSISGVSDNPKHLAKVCGGLLVPDAQDSSLFEKAELNLDYLILFHETNMPETDGAFFKDFFYKLCGTEELKNQIENGLSAQEIRESWQYELNKYKELRKKYLLYL